MVACVCCIHVCWFTSCQMVCVLRLTHACLPRCWWCCQQVFGRVQSGRGTGTVGHLTHGLITRQSYYEHAVALALIPYLHPSTLYPGY
jgi:hypothetical protein